MKKVFCVVICVAICAALVCVPVFATSAPETTSAPNVFHTLFEGDGGTVIGYSLSYSGSELSTSGASSLAGFLNSVGAVGSVSDPTEVPFTGKDDRSRTVSGNLVLLSGYYYAAGNYDDKIISVSSCTFSSPDSTVGRNYAISFFGSAAVTDSLAPSGGLVQNLGDEVFSVGGSFITFVMSNWIVLIPVVAFLVILCIGVIKKTVKGA